METKKTWGCPRLSHYQALALPPSRISNAVGPRREISHITPLRGNTIEKDDDNTPNADVPAAVSS